VSWLLRSRCRVGWFDCSQDILNSLKLYSVLFRSYVSCEGLLWQKSCGTFDHLVPTLRVSDLRLPVVHPIRH
jgi:hypothetical protein